VSRAFVREDRDEAPQPITLPSPDSPSYDVAAANALLEAARAGQTALAEAATGYRWGEPQLRPHVQRILDEATAVPELERDHRLIQVARRFLRG
jgi:hypothetical protein